MNSKRIGNIGEAAALMKFVEIGIPVYLPFGDNEKADLLVGELYDICEKILKNKKWWLKLFSEVPDCDPGEDGALPSCHPK